MNSTSTVQHVQGQKKNPARGCLILIGALLLAAIARPMTSSPSASAPPISTSPPSAVTTATPANNLAITSSPAAPTSVPSLGASLKVTANFRSGPGTNYQVYRELAAGTQVKLIAVRDTETGKWYKASFDSQEGWLSEKVLDLVPEIVAQVPPDSDAMDGAGVTPKGIGISRADIMSIFSQPDIGFTFEPSTPVRGQERYIGQAPSRLANIELIGPADNLTSASIMVGMPSDNNLVVAENSVYMLGLLKNAIPNWDEGSEWLADNLPTAIDTGEARTVHDNREVSIVVVKELGLMTLSVRAAE